MKNDLDKSVFKDETPQEVDTQTDRSGGEFRKGGSPKEIHESERVEYQDAEELGAMLHGGKPANKEAQSIIKAERKEETNPLRWELNWI